MGDEVCVVCKKDRDDEFVIFCDGKGCDKPFHTYCVKGCLYCKKKPSLFGKVPEVPEGDFYCKFCAGRLDSSVDIGTRVYAFGHNEGGQLGIGSEEHKNSPALVSDLVGVPIKQMAVGGWNSILLTKEDLVYTCGDGTNGKTGHGDVCCESMPRFRLVQELCIENRYQNEGDLVKVECGRDCMIAVTSEGHIFTWGTGQHGKLGHQDMGNKKVPKKISALRSLELAIAPEVSAGWYSVAALGTEYGELYSWGGNQGGQLGSGDQVSKWVPQLMNPFGDIRGYPQSYVCQNTEPFPLAQGAIAALSVGKMHSVALTTDGSVWTWGAGSGGQLGLPPLPSQLEAKSFMPARRIESRPQLISSLPLITQICAGEDHVLCVTQAGSVMAWGLNRYGQLGLDPEVKDGKSKPIVKQWTPKVIDSLPPVRSVASGDNHCLALTADGTVYTWGKGGAGQLGHGTWLDKPTPTLLSIPTLVSESKPITSICAGGDHSFIIHQPPMPMADYLVSARPVYRSMTEVKPKEPAPKPKPKAKRKKPSASKTKKKPASSSKKGAKKAKKAKTSTKKKSKKKKN